MFCSEDNRIEQNSGEWNRTEQHREDQKRTYRGNEHGTTWYDRNAMRTQNRTKSGPTELSIQHGRTEPERVESYREEKNNTVLEQDTAKKWVQKKVNVP